MKKLLPIIGALVLIGGVVFIALTKQAAPQNLLGQDPKLHLYTVGGESTGQLNVTLPFSQKSEGVYAIDIALDRDGDGRITESEWQVKDAGAYLVQDLKNNYWLTDEAKTLAAGDEVLLKISFKKSDNSVAPATLEKNVTIEAFEIGELYGFGVL